MNTPSAPDRLEQLVTRVTNLEESLTFCQRTLDDLDQVMRDFQKRLDGLEGQLLELNKQLGLIANSISDDEDTAEHEP